MRNCFPCQSEKLLRCYAHNVVNCHVFIEGGLSFNDGCDTKINNNQVGSIVRVNISSAETGRYGVAGQFKVYLEASASTLYNMKLWRKKYKLPVINVSCIR